MSVFDTETRSQIEGLDRGKGVFSFARGVRGVVSRLAERRQRNSLQGQGAQSLREAPSIGSILEGLQGGPTQQDIQLATDANFGSLEPAISDALSFGRANAAQRGFRNDSTIGAALQARALRPIIGEARRGASQALLQLPFQRASALSGLRGQAFGEAAQGQQLDLQERQFAFQQQQAKKKKGGFFKKLLGAGLGAAVGAFTGGLGTAAFGAAKGFFGGGGSSAPDTFGTGGSTSAF